MKPEAYIETSVVGYLTAWPSRDIVIAGHQQITRQWWATAADRFELVASQLVIDEASAGDAEASRDRLAALASVTFLDATDEALQLAEELVAANAIPETRAEDAAHIAIGGPHDTIVSPRSLLSDSANTSRCPSVDAVPES